MYKISYTGDGVTNEFMFAFPFFHHDDVRVAFDDELVEQNLYSVRENEDFTGGVVHFITPPQEGVSVDIFRRILLRRVVDYQPTAQIDPEDLNTDFNMLFEAFKDFSGVELDLAQWEYTHSKVLEFLEYTNTVIEDKLGGASVLGLYNNLLHVLNNALPTLINDYGYVTEAAPNETRDDYGLL